MIHSVSLPIPVAWLFENIIVAHSTEAKIFKQAWAHHFQPCCVPAFQNASLIRAMSGPNGMLGSNAHRHFVAFNHVGPIVWCFCSARL